LEARWAAFFDQIGMRHTYEPIDDTDCIPDFLLFGAKFAVLVEVKPAVAEAEYRDAIPKMTAGLEGHRTGELLILGLDPLPAWELEPREPADFPPMGLLGYRRDGGWISGSCPGPLGAPRNSAAIGQRRATRLSGNQRSNDDRTGWGVYRRRDL
jgi:hypothetical protein